MHKFLGNKIKKSAAYKEFLKELSNEEYDIDNLLISDFIMLSDLYRKRDYDKFRLDSSYSRKYEELINTKNVMITYYEAQGEYQRYYIYITNGGNEVYIRTEKINEKGDLIRANKIHVNYFDTDYDMVYANESMFSIEKVVGNSEYTFSKVIMYFDSEIRYRRREIWDNEHNYNDPGHHNMICELLDTVNVEDDFKQLRKRYKEK